MYLRTRGTSTIIISPHFKFDDISAIFTEGHACADASV